MFSLRSIHQTQCLWVGDGKTGILSLTFIPAAGVAEKWEEHGGDPFPCLPKTEIPVGWVRGTNV